MPSENEVVICIPTKRPPPILTFESYGFPLLYQTLVICDPFVFEAHKQYYENRHPDIQVMLGKSNIGGQLFDCYQRAALFEFPYFAKVDDDLPPKTFVSKDGYPDLEDVIDELYECLLECNVTHAGLSNTSNTHWLGTGAKRTFGLVHGGTNIAISSLNPIRFIDPRICRGGDVYRTCAHRRLNKGVGRVGHIGFDKSKSTISQTSFSVTQEEVDLSKEIILSTFPGMVKVSSAIVINGVAIPKYRMLRIQGEY